MKTEEITYHYEDKNYIGFVAYPDKELAPLVLIAHTWAGRDSFVEERAKELLSSLPFNNLETSTEDKDDLVVRPTDVAKNIQEANE